MAMKRNEADFQARRTVILDKAAELYAQRGCDDVSLRQIAWVLGRTERILTGMFDGKQDVMRSLMERHVDGLLEAVGAASEATHGTKRGRLAAMAIAYAERVRDTHDAHVVTLRETCRLIDPYKSVMQSKVTWLQTLFQHAIEAAMPSVRRDTAASLMLARSLLGALDAQPKLAWGDARSEADLARTAVAMVLAPGVRQALMPQRGDARREQHRRLTRA